MMLGDWLDGLALQAVATNVFADHGGHYRHNVAVKFIVSQPLINGRRRTQNNLYNLPRAVPIISRLVTKIAGF